jgi:hypothetical protein
MRRLFSALLLTLVSAPGAFADIYKWTDADGTLHLTDDMHKVPQEFRRSIEVIKTEPVDKDLLNGEPPATLPKRPGIFDAPASPAEPIDDKATTPGPELYGDYPLDWWKNEFAQKNREIETIKKAIAEKSEYVSLFDSGKRFGQVYDAEKIERYRKFKEELPADETRLSGLSDELSELRRKARTFGVPREVRGE